MASDAAAAVPITPTPRLILFDLDDTLCDYASARSLRLRLAFSREIAANPDLPTSVDVERMVAASLAMHSHGTDHFSELFRLFGIADPALATAAAEWYRHNRFLGLELFDDAVTTIAALRGFGTPGPERSRRRIGVITNGPAEVQRAKVDLLGIENLVDFVIISGEYGVAKPDPAIFAEALRLGSRDAAEAIFIGDSIEHDMAGARSAGIRSVWMNRTGGAWPSRETPPTYVVSSLTSLLPLLGHG